MGKCVRFLANLKYIGYGGMRYRLRRERDTALQAAGLLVGSGSLLQSRCGVLLDGAVVNPTHRDETAMDGAPGHPKPGDFGRAWKRRITAGLAMGAVFWRFCLWPSKRQLRQR